MPSAHDVAAFIDREWGRPTSMKLQKLLYYAQAWSLVWDGGPLFAEPIEAWADGPVVRSVFGRRKHGVEQGDPDELSDAQQETVREVLRVYARHQGDWLSSLSHRELPWCEARGSTPSGERSTSIISLATMRAFYGSAGAPAKSIPEAYQRGMRLLVALPEDEAGRMFTERVAIRGEDAIGWLMGEGPATWPASSG